MAHTLAAPQKKLIEQLLKAGPWSSEGEIIRHGLKLVSQELKSASPRSLSECTVTSASASTALQSAVFLRDCS